MALSSRFLLALKCTPGRKLRRPGGDSHPHLLGDSVPIPCTVRGQGHQIILFQFRITTRGTAARRTSHSIRATPSVPRSRPLFHFLRGHREERNSCSLLQCYSRSLCLARCFYVIHFCLSTPFSLTFPAAQCECSCERQLPNKNLTNVIADAKKPFSSVIVPRYLLTSIPYTLFFVLYGKEQKGTKRTVSGGKATL